MAPKAKPKSRSGTSTLVLLKRAKAQVASEVRKRRAAERALAAARKELQRQQQQPQQQPQQQRPSIAQALEVVCSGELEREHAAQVVARLRQLHWL